MYKYIYIYVYINSRIHRAHIGPMANSCSIVNFRLLL